MSTNKAFNSGSPSKNDRHRNNRQNRPRRVRENKFKKSEKQLIGLKDGFQSKTQLIELNDGKKIKTYYVFPSNVRYERVFILL